MIEQADLDEWFCNEVLPLERQLLRFIRRHSPGMDDVHDLLHEAYVSALNAARSGIPRQSQSYMFTVIKNCIIRKAKRARVVSFELIADVEHMGLPLDIFATDRHLAARDELRRAQQGIEHLPPRCREVIRLRKVEGLTTRETAERLGVGVDAIEQQIVKGMRYLTDFMLGDEDECSVERLGQQQRKKRVQ